MGVRKQIIEIGGENQEVQIFDSMWEYITHYGSDITHYRLDPYQSEEDNIVDEFMPSEDVEFGVRDIYEIEGMPYAYVNWGEDERSLVPENDLNAVFWTVYERGRPLEYICRGDIYQSRDEALANI